MNKLRHDSARGLMLPLVQLYLLARPPIAAGRDSTWTMRGTVRPKKRLAPRLLFKLERAESQIRLFGAALFDGAAFRVVQLSWSLVWSLVCLDRR